MGHSGDHCATLQSYVNGSAIHIETDDFIEETLARPLQVVYRDEHYVAVFKPAGLIVHRSNSTAPHEPVLLQALRDQLGCHVFPVHRLDRPTAGLILFGLNGQSAAKMVDLFTRRMVDKHYQALVMGAAKDQGLVNTPLSASVDDCLEQSSSDKNSMQEALTHYRTLSRFKLRGNKEPRSSTFSLLEINPKTGRSHQIRRHLAQIGHPIIGDQRHGHCETNQIIRNETGIPRMLLTSMRLDFRHPYTGELESILVGRGSSFDKVISQLE